MSARGLLALTSMLLLALSCQLRPPAERLLDDYLTRLSRVLDQPHPEVERQSPPRMPRHRDLYVDIEPLSVNVLDYWEFRKCGLAEILGERNSVLGRVMPPSQHLHMDGRILLQLAYCRAELEEEALIALATELEGKKRAQWPARYWNATAASPELRAFWSPSTRPLVPGEETSYRSAEAALAYLERLPDRLRAGNWPPMPDLERQYQQLDRYQLGGKLLQSMQLAHDYLQRANQMLGAATEQRTLCPQGLQKKELQYARNVMVKVFVGEVQPWLAAVNRRASSLLEQYAALIERQTPELQPRIVPYQTAINGLHRRFQQSNRAHVDHWQKLFDSCDSKAIEP